MAEENRTSFPKKNSHVSGDTSIELWRRFTAGEADVSEAIYRRYAEGLLLVARRRLSARLARRVDAEDVVQSAYRSFFIRGRNGEFRIERSGDLWRLLTTITVKKLLGQVEFHRAQQRDIHRDWAPGEQLLERLSQQPSPVDLAVAVDELQAIMSPLSPPQRQALELRLQDYTFEEIAERTGRAERTIRRWLAAVQQRLQAQAAEDEERRGNE